MLKFLSKVLVEYSPLDPGKAAMLEPLAQCNGRKAKDSNPACYVELRCLPSTPATADDDPKPLLPPRVLVTYFNGAEEAFVVAATAQGIHEQILARGRLIETEQMFREAGEKWPVVIPKEELGLSFTGIKIMSNDKYKSVEHRVVMNSRQEARVSIGIFFNPGKRGDSIFYGPLAQLVSSENPPKYRNFTMSEFLGTFFKRDLASKALIEHFKL